MKNPFVAHGWSVSRRSSLGLSLVLCAAGVLDVIGMAAPVQAARPQDRCTTRLGGSGASALRTVCSPPGSSEEPPGSEQPIRLLAFSRTEGFRHPSIDDAKLFLGGLPAGKRIAVTLTEETAIFTDQELAGFDVVAFVNTTGDVLDDVQQGALERFVRSGKGYVGVHSAADTEYTWPWYGRLVGAYFVSHPLLPLEVTVTAEDRDHPSTDHFPVKFRFTDEWYNFDRNPRTDNAILLTVDEAGFTLPNIPTTPSMGADHPVAWYKEFEGGRSFYTNLGHRPETWHDPMFQQHLLAGIRWAASHVTFNRIVLTDVARNPMALAVAPDGRVYYIERTGEVRLWRPATGRSTLAAKLEVDTAFENGLLGIALDPDFARNRWIYLYRSVPVSDPPPASGPKGENVLSRFAVRADGTIDLDGRIDLLSVPSERECCHEAGSLAFGPDRTLFLATGDNTDPFGDAMGHAPLDERPGHEQFNSQRTAPNPSELRGKILRIRPDGTIPPGNLFPPSGVLGRPEIYTMGNRNPFRITVDQVTGRLFWGEVGPDAFVDEERGPRGYDEINFADGPGNYGWPYCIAQNIAYPDVDFATGTVGPFFSCAGRVPALLAYDYLTVTYPALGRGFGEGKLDGRTAIAGVFYRKPRGLTPFALAPPYTDTLLMAEWSRDLLLSLEVSKSGELKEIRRFLPFERFNRPIDLEVGRDGALYVLEYGSGYFGDNVDARLSRIEYSATGRLTPVAVVSASPTAGRAPLTVTLLAEGSRAAGWGDTIARYEWDLDGDGRMDREGPSIVHTFDQNGAFPVTLTAVTRSGRRSFPAVEEVVVGNTPPEVRILSPADGTRVPEGTMVTLEGSGTDAEDGEVACDELIWDIRLGHNSHSHPIVMREGCTVSFLAREPGGHSATTRLFYAIELSHTDHGGAGGLPELTGRAAIQIEFAPAGG